MEQPRDARLLHAGCSCKNRLGFGSPGLSAASLHLLAITCPSFSPNRGKRAADNTSLPCCGLKCLPDSLPPCSGPEMGDLGASRPDATASVGDDGGREEALQEETAQMMQCQDVRGTAFALLPAQPKH